MTEPGRLGEPRIRVYLDDHAEPLADYRPPAEVSFDTHGIIDGEHRFRIEARDASGDTGVHIVPFTVRNGPGITVSGLRSRATVHGTVSFRVNVFGAEEPFEPQRAESRTPTPVWVWVLALVITAWSAWYVATLWTPPPQFANTPTFATPVMGPWR